MSIVQRIIDNNDLEMDYNGRYTSSNVEYLVLEANCAEDAVNAIRANADTSYNGLPIFSIEISEHIGEKSWRVKVTYKNDNGSSGGDGDDDEPSMSFDTTGGRRHVDFAIVQNCIWDQNSGACFYQTDNAINYKHDSASGKTEIKGVDIPSADPKVTYSKVFSASSLSTNYMKKLAYYTCYINLKPWRGWDIGELLFLGASFSGKKSDRIRVNYSFAYRPTESNAVIDGHVMSKPIYGWHYISTVNRTQIINGIPTPKVKQVLRADIFNLVDFSVLGI